MVDRIDNLDGNVNADAVASQATDTAAVDQDNTPDGFQHYANLVRLLTKEPHSGWKAERVKELKQAATDAMREQAVRGDLRDQFTLQRLRQTRQARMHQMLESLDPPDEVKESPDFQALLEMLRPPSQRHGGSSFQKGSSLKGKVKGEIAAGRVSEAVETADRLATHKRVLAKKNADGEESTHGFSEMTLAQMARFLRRKKRKKRAGGDDVEVGEAGEVDAEDDITPEEIELFASRALATMRALREEIAPKWAPNQQPWLINEGDKQVYDILLAVIPKELFEQTNAWGEIQDLRAGQEVFTLRAADKLTEATRRR